SPLSAGLVVAAPGRGIHDIPHNHPSPCSGRAPRATTASPVLIPIRTWKSRVGIVLVSRDRLQDREPAPDRPLCVVLMCNRRPADRHDGVTNELLHRCAVPLDALPHVRVVGTNSSAHVLGIPLLGSSGKNRPGRRTTPSRPSAPPALAPAPASVSGARSFC